MAGGGGRGRRRGELASPSRWSVGSLPPARLEVGVVSTTILRQIERMYTSLRKHFRACEMGKIAMQILDEMRRKGKPMQ